MSTATDTKEQQSEQTGLAPAQSLTPAAPSNLTGKAATVRLGLAPTTIEEGWRMAQYMAQSGLVPKNFQGKPADVLVAIEMGIELGLPPMQALQSIAVINGRPSVWGDGFLALIMSSPLYADHDEFYEVDGQRKDGLVADDLKKDATAAVCTFHRKGKATPVTRRFTVAQAKKASLLGKEGPWQTYPDRMLAMRARSFAGRDAFPDLLRGIRTAEEAMDTPPDIDVDVQPTREVRRISETVTASTTTVPGTSVAGPGTSTPVATEETIGPVQVKEVEQFLGGYTATLANGQKVDVINVEDALELEKFKNSGHKVRLVVTRIENGLALKSFSIAD
jgi:hypothetical protein